MIEKLSARTIVLLKYRYEVRKRFMIVYLLLTRQHSPLHDLDLIVGSGTEVGPGQVTRQSIGI
jgi:hypothetical protein